MSHVSASQKVISTSLSYSRVPTGESHELPKGTSALSPLTSGLLAPPLLFHKQPCLLSSDSIKLGLPLKAFLTNGRGEAA